MSFQERTPESFLFPSTPLSFEDTVRKWPSTSQKESLSLEIESPITLILDDWPPEIVRNEYQLFKSQSLVLCYDSPSRLR